MTDELEAAVGGDPQAIDWGDPEVRKEIRPIIADRATTAQFLASKGEVLTRTAMDMFLDDVVGELVTATNLLNRRAEGDFSEDQHLKTLPEYRKAKPAVRGAGKTCFELFEAYVKAVKPARSTITRWRCVFPVLDKHLDGRNIDDFTADEAQRWARSLDRQPPQGKQEAPSLHGQEHMG